MPVEEQESSAEVEITLNNTVLYNAMIHPFTRMVIKGALWYQGMRVQLTSNRSLILLQENIMLASIATNTLVHSLN